MNKIFKTEGTSKTYGQFVVSQNSAASMTKVANTNPAGKYSGTTSTVKILKTSAPVVTEQQVVKKDPIVGAVVEDTTKTQLLLAAANSNTNSTVVVEDKTSDVSLQNLGNPQTIEESVSVLQSETLSKEEVLSVLTEAQKLDLSISMRSQSSEAVEYNTLQIPQFQLKFIYKKWEVNETDLVSQEDPAKDPLLNKKLKEVPRYVEFVWDSINTVEQISENLISKTVEMSQFKNKIFKDPRGIGRYSGEGSYKPVSRSLKNINLIKEDLTKGKVVDIHDIEKGFNSVANKHEFVNSVLVKIQQPKNTQNSLVLNLSDIIKNEH